MAASGSADDPASIDVHAHCVPPQVIAQLEADEHRFGIEVVERDGRQRVVIAGKLDAGPLHPGLTDMPRRLSVMDATGIDVQVMSSWIDLTAYHLPADAGVRYARMFNEALAAAAAEYPRRFATLCTVPLQSPDAAGAELRHAVAELGMAGVEIATTVAGRDLDDAGLDPFWAAAEELQCLVLLHPCASLAGRGVSRYFLGNLVGNPAESTVALGHLIFGGVLERHPQLRLCAVHGGGFAPFQAGRWDHAYRGDVRGAAAHLTRPPSEWLSRLYYDTVLHSQRSLRLLLDMVGPEHVVLGSDYPFEMGDPDPLATIASVPGLGDAERQQIRSENMLGLLASVRRREPAS